jgi:hypothetical protein
VFVLSGRGLCDGPIPRPDESYRLWCVSQCDQVKINNLYTYCEQVGRKGQGYDSSVNKVNACEVNGWDATAIRGGSLTSLLPCQGRLSVQ